MKFSDDEILWKQRFQCLIMAVGDAVDEIVTQNLEVDPNRVWACYEFIYVSFNHDITDNEESAIKNFGEGNYDVYTIYKPGKEWSGKCI